jgi:hypothetical protein
MMNACSHHFFAPTCVVIETWCFLETRRLPGELGMGFGLVEYELALGGAHLEDES